MENELKCIECGETGGVIRVFHRQYNGTDIDNHIKICIGGLCASCRSNEDLIQSLEDDAEESYFTEDDIHPLTMRDFI